MMLDFTHFNPCEEHGRLVYENENKLNAKIHQQENKREFR